MRKAGSSLVKRACTTRKFATEQLSTLERFDERPLKQFRQIQQEMSDKTKRLRKSLPMDNTLARPKIIHSKIQFRDLKGKLHPGDMIMIQSSVYAIVQLPKDYTQPITVCDAKGVTRSILPAMITAKLGSLVPPTSKVLQNALNEDGSSISVGLYNYVGYALGNLQNNAFDVARTLLPKVIDLIKTLQTDNVPITLSFYDLCRKVQLDGNDTGNFVPEFTPPFILAMRMVFDHHQIRDKVRLEFGYTKRDVIVIKSRKDENMHIDVSSHDTTMLRQSRIPRIFVQYVKDYVLENLSTTNHTSEGTALQILRSNGLDSQTIDNSNALEWVNNFDGLLNQEGPMLDRTAYHFFLNPPPFNQRLEEHANAAEDKLKHLRTAVEEVVYCIDSDDTTEVDDGISIKRQGNIATLGVHIANPTSCIEDSGVIVDAIKQRSTTVYMPHGRIKMLPDAFAQHYSLENGSRALTVEITIDLSTMQRTGATLRATTLKNVCKLNYETAQQLIQKDQNLSLLYELSSAFLKERKSHGAILNMAVQTNAKVQVIDGKASFTSNSTPRSQQLVSECMLQANATMAKFAFDNKIPCIYRSNEPHFYSEQQEKEFYSQDIIGLEWMQSMRPAVESTDPAPHKASGLQMYTFSTSPLRRAQDLILHVQIEAYLLGQAPPLSKPMLDNLIPSISTSQALVKKFQRQIDRFYILSFLEDKMGQQMEGIIVPPMNGEEVDQIFLSGYGVYAQLSSEGALPASGASTFVLHKVNAITDTLVVRKFKSRL